MMTPAAKKVWMRYYRKEMKYGASTDYIKSFTEWFDKSRARRVSYAGNEFFICDFEGCHHVAIVTDDKTHICDLHVQLFPEAREWLK